MIENKLGNSIDLVVYARTNWYTESSIYAWMTGTEILVSEQKSTNRSFYRVQLCLKTPNILVKTALLNIDIEKAFGSV